MNVKSLLRSRSRDQIVGLFIERSRGLQGSCTGGPVDTLLPGVDGMQNLHAILEASSIDTSGQDDVANGEIRTRGIARQDEGVVLVAQEPRCAAAEFFVDRISELHIRRHRLAIP